MPWSSEIGAWDLLTKRLSALALALLWRREPQRASGRNFADPRARGTRRKPACRSNGVNRATFSGRRPCRAAAGRRRLSPASRIWLTTAIDSSDGRRGVSLRALAFDIASGREVVNTEVFRVDRPDASHSKNSYASPTPIVDGDRVYVHFGAQGTAALTTAGEVVWKTRLDYQSQHGNGGSPALHGDLLIINCDGNGGDAYVAALDVKTGKTRWKTPRRQPADQAYTTPLVIRVGRPRPGRQRRRVSRRCLRSVERQGDLAGVVRRWVLERAEAGLRAGPGVHRHRLHAAVAHRRAAPTAPATSPARTSPGRCAAAHP